MEDIKRLTSKIEYIVYQELMGNFDDIDVYVDINLTREPIMIDSYFIGIDCNYKYGIDNIDAATFLNDFKKVSDLVHSAASSYIMTSNGRLKKHTIDDNVHITEPRIDKIEFVAEETHKFSFSVMVIPNYNER
jgi:hypothetical protein